MGDCRLNAVLSDKDEMRVRVYFSKTSLGVCSGLMALALGCVGVARAQEAAGGAGAGAEPLSTSELEIGSPRSLPERPAWVPGAGRAVSLDPPGEASSRAARHRHSRRVAVFDFEETNDVGVKLGRGVPLPPGWYAVGRAPQSSDANFERLPLHANLAGRLGFPPYNPVGYSALGAGRSASVPGANDPVGYALHLGLQGGNSAAFVQVGRLPVVPGTRYRVSAAVCTAGLKHAGARLVAYFVDAQGNRLGASVRQTPRLRTRGQWRDVEVVLAAVPRAAYLGLQVELVQPVADGLNPLGEHQVVGADVSGDAWFDDVEVEQLPQVRVSSDSVVGVVRSAVAPGWRVTVRDLRGEQLMAQLSLYDAWSRRVAFEQRPLNWGAAAAWRWAPSLRAYGYYRVVLQIIDGAGAPVSAQDSHAVVWLPPAEPLAADDSPQAAEDLHRFALLAEDAPSATLGQLPDLLRALGLRSAVVSALARDTAGVAIHERVVALQRYLDRAESAGLRTEVSLHPLPDELHAGTRAGATAAAVLGGAVDRWFGYLQPILSQDGARVTAWHLGGAATGRAADATPVSLAGVAQLVERLRHWTAAPRLVLPGALTGVPASVVDGSAGWQAVWPAGLTAAALAELAPTDGGGGASERGAQRRWVLDLPRGEALGHPERVAQAALRVVAAWEQGATGVALDRPWVAGPHGATPRLTPDPVVGVVAQAARRLAGFRAAGRLPLPEGLRAVIFGPVRAGGESPLGDAAGDQAGMLVAWNERAPAGQAAIEVSWGPHVRAVDVWGNPVAVTEVRGGRAAEPGPASADRRRVRVPLGDAPVFITGLDARTLAFRAGFGIDQPLVPARQTPHDRTLTLRNPWPVTLSGSLAFTGPPGWDVTPRQRNFTIPAGGRVSLPVRLRFPVNALAGRHLLTARARFTSRGRHEVALVVPVELGLPGLGFEPQLALEAAPHGGELRAVVSCVVTNRKDTPVSLSVFTSLPGHPRQERLIARLAPGEVVRRRLVFNDVAAALRDYDISVGLRETSGAGVLNARVGLDRAGGDPGQR